jgi:hypothetical protein
MAYNTRYIKMGFDRLSQISPDFYRPVKTAATKVLIISWLPKFLRLFKKWHCFLRRQNVGRSATAVINQ